MFQQHAKNVYFHVLMCYIKHLTCGNIIYVSGWKVFTWTINTLSQIKISNFLMTFLVQLHLNNFQFSHDIFIFSLRFFFSICSRTRFSKLLLWENVINPIKTIHYVSNMPYKWGKWKVNFSIFSFFPFHLLFLFFFFNNQHK